ncbi:MAG: sigma-70 family RNA polymerase sigma factor, partial [Planctomycetes bacterium]|nr:sigma-70 family RNA polymerase sigma factor [Planctomycetota bacterium]
MIVATDGELLMRFVRHGDQSAFAEVVERHGRLVWMVCRQILRQHQDVEDAFQATFLILAQRAQAIRAADSAAAWLLKVAQRTALAARRKRTRRREESLAAEPPQGEGAFPVIHEREMRYALLDELRMLPARYQTPLIMRYLEGESRRAIAEQTDSTVGQVQGRLARGRRMLRSRLVRRGVSLSLAAGTIAGTSSQATAAVTSTLVAATAKSCLALKISGAAGSASPAALQLAHEGVKAMWWASIFKTTMAVTSTLMVAAVVWAVPTGGGGATNETAGPETPAGIALEANADQPAPTPETPAVAVASNPGEEVQWVANPLPPERQQLSNLIAQLT